jgi:hypothetical protein
MFKDLGNMSKQMNVFDTRTKTIEVRQIETQ